MVRTVKLKNYSDVHFTRPNTAKQIIDHFGPTGRCLEPFAGEGAFLQYLPEDSLSCELSRGADFFEFTTQVDWIVTNPPFSNLTQIFEHAFSISQHCVFLIPISKYWSSMPRLSLASRYGGLKEILHVGTGRDIGFNLGFPFAAMHFERDYGGTIKESAIINDG